MSPTASHGRVTSIIGAHTVEVREVGQIVADTGNEPWMTDKCLPGRMALQAGRTYDWPRSGGARTRAMFLCLTSVARPWRRVSERACFRFANHGRADRHERRSDRVLQIDGDFPEM
ncbi:hypothetical protein GFL86_34535 [Rhizobium laguerreae]|nr:hypothetical protein [Rhizobium laguerreae]